MLVIGQGQARGKELVRLQCGFALSRRRKRGAPDASRTCGASRCLTRRFQKISAAAGLPTIKLHDVRHSYATAGRDAKIAWKALSQRIGHADVAFTMKQYVQADLVADRQVATTLAELILGGTLSSAVTAYAVTVPELTGRQRGDAA
jgi:integrase